MKTKPPRKSATSTPSKTTRATTKAQASRGPTIADYMTPSPHSVAVNRTLADAHSLMRQHRIRHLPVLEGGKLVGIVTQRDLHLVETLKGVDSNEVEVEEAMSPDVYVVQPDTPLIRVALEMWKKKYGSAVVMRGNEVAGVFTTVDALRALATLIARDTAPAPRATKTAAKKATRAAPKAAPKAATKARAKKRP